MYLCTPNFGVGSTKVGQHNILLLTFMHVYRMHCIMHVCRNMCYLYDQYITFVIEHLRSCEVAKDVVANQIF